MSAPHEVRLTRAAFDKERRCLVDDGGRMVAILRAEDAIDWERFFAGAGDVVQALLALGRVEWVGNHREWHLGACWQQLHERGADCLQGCSDARAALNKAGVPLS